MKILVDDIHVTTIIGVYEDERVTPQEILISYEIDYDGEQASQSDDVEDTLDYCELSKEIAEKVAGTDFELVERLLDFVLDIIMVKRLVNQATVTIAKPHALAKFGALVRVQKTRTSKQ